MDILPAKVVITVLDGTKTFSIIKDIVYVST